jgi:hypothetical protein
MKKLLSILLLIVSVNFIYGQQCSSYALHWDSNLSTEFLVSIDPSTGAVTKIDSISNVDYIQSGFSALDAQSGVFYFIGQDASFNGSLYSIDLSNGSVIANPNFPPAAINGNVNELQINPITGELFALHWDSNLSTEFLVSIDPNTGAVTKIDSISNVDYIQSGFSALDAQSGVFYFIGQDASFNGSLYSIDLSNGSVIANPNFPPAAINGNVNELQFPNLLTQYINVSNTSICNSDSSMLFISGNYNNYLWSNGDTTNPIYVSDSSLYSVTLTKDYGCQTNSNEVSINIFDCSTFVDSLSYSLDTCLFDSASIVMAYVNDVTISNDTVYLLWNFITNNGDTIMLNANYYFTQNGVYTISISGNCNGQKTDSDFFFDLIEINHVSTGIENQKLSLLEFDIYPNPTSDFLTILSDQLTINKITIIDISGKALKIISTDSNVIDITELPSGIYFIKIIAKDKTITKKFVKK